MELIVIEVEESLLSKLFEVDERDDRCFNVDVSNN
jgi:hypothetical protein